MIQFTATIKKFKEKGEKSGWTYIEISEEQAQTLKPGNKKAFRVKGKLDNYQFEGISLLPMGEGDFIMALNATIRKAIKKDNNEKVKVTIEIDTKEKPLSVDFTSCLEDEPSALKYFQTLPKSHQKYFSDWIESAKTETTKTKRLTQAITALSMKMGFPEMVRYYKKNSNL
ncbi:MAG: YdeI/OmpD-associated family protein [Cytophagaceae bacterium]